MKYRGNFFMNNEMSTVGRFYQCIVRQGGWVYTCATVLIFRVDNSNLSRTYSNIYLKATTQTIKTFYI